MSSSLISPSTLSGILFIGNEVSDVARQLEKESKVRVHKIPPVMARNHPRWLAEPEAEGSAIGQGAAGCALAHELAWQRIAALKGQPDSLYLVLEDDSVGSTNWLRRLHDTITVSIVSGFDLVHLGRMPSRGFVGKLADFRARVLKTSEITSAASSEVTLHFLLGFAWRTHAYLVSGRLAAALAKHPLPLTKPVDQFLMELRDVDRLKNRVISRTLFPGIFYTSDRPSMVDSLGR